MLMGRGQAVLHNSRTKVNYGASDSRADGAAVPEPLPYRTIIWSAATCRRFRWARRVAPGQSAVVPAHSKSMIRTMNWPHAPRHWLFEPGIYMVTAGTFQKLHHLSTPERRDFFLESLFACAAEFGWQLRAWAVLSNHYHFVAASPPDPATLRRFLGKLHMTAAKQLNEWDGTAGRKVWFQSGTATSHSKRRIWRVSTTCTTIRSGTE